MPHTYLYLFISVSSLNYWKDRTKTSKTIRKYKKLTSCVIELPECCVESLKNRRKHDLKGNTTEGNNLLAKTI